MAQDTSPVIKKDPNATLDYVFKWTKWLNEGETIVSHLVTVPAGLVKETDSLAGSVITVWLSGGIHGTTYDVTCRVTTSAGRTDERTMRIAVKNR